MTEPLAARERLAVALDVASLAEAREIARALCGVPGWFKVGAELFTAEGPAALEVARASARVFLDTKIHDIPNTAARAVAAATRTGVDMLTLHVSGGLAMLRAARDAAGEAAAAAGREPPALIGVTVLTSLTDADLKDLGFAAGRVEEQVARGVDLALEASLDGVVASPLEVTAVRRRAGPGLRVVTPGIRSPGHAADDQSRTASPAVAIAAGADVLVVGRPIVRAADPAAAAREILREIEACLAGSGD